MIERANADFEGSRKEVWALVSRGKINIGSVKNKAGISVTSTQGKFQTIIWLR